MKMICIRWTVAPYNLAHDDKLHDKSGYKLYQFVTLTWAPIPNALLWFCWIGHSKSDQIVVCVRFSIELERD